MTNEIIYYKDDNSLQEPGYYIVAGGASAYHTISHINEGIRHQGFNVKLSDITQDIGVLSLQGPNSRAILQNLTDCDLCDENLPARMSKILDINTESGGTDIFTF